MEKKQGEFGSVIVDPQKNIVKRKSKFAFMNPLVLKTEQFVQRDFRSKFDPDQKITKRLINLEDKKKKESIYGYAGPTVYESILKNNKKKYKWKQLKPALLRFIKTALDLSKKHGMIYGDLHYNNICFDGKNFYFIDNSSWMTNYAFVKFKILDAKLPEMWQNPYKFVKKNNRILGVLTAKHDEYKKTLKYFMGYTDPSKIMHMLLGKVLYDLYNETKEKTQSDHETEKIMIGLLQPDPSKRVFLQEKTTSRPVS